MWSMSAKRIERGSYVGAGLLAVAIVGLLLVSPLEAIWTAAIIFGVAAVALGVQTLLFNSRHRRHDQRRHRSAHSPSSV